MYNTIAGVARASLCASHHDCSLCMNENVADSDSRPAPLPAQQPEIDGDTLDAAVAQSILTRINESWCVLKPQSALIPMQALCRVTVQLKMPDASK